MLRTQIQDEIKQSMRNKDQLKLETLRYIWSEIKNGEIDAQHEFTDDEIVKVLKREVKKRKEAIDQFTAAGREDLAESEKVKLSIIEVYLPQQLSVGDVENIVDEVILSGTSDFGGVMKEVMSQVGDAADGKIVSEIVKQKLANLV